MPCKNFLENFMLAATRGDENPLKSWRKRRNYNLKVIIDWVYSIILYVPFKLISFWCYPKQLFRGVELVSISCSHAAIWFRNHFLFTRERDGSGVRRRSSVFQESREIDTSFMPKLAQQLKDCTHDTYACSLGHCTAMRWAQWELDRVGNVRTWLSSFTIGCWKVQINLTLVRFLTGKYRLPKKRWILELPYPKSFL